MEKIIEPDAVYTFAEWTAIMGASVILLVVLIGMHVIRTAAKRRLESLHDEDNWNWW